MVPTAYEFWVHDDDRLHDRFRYERDGDAWRVQRLGPPHWPVIEMTMWIDKETYAPMRFTDHSWGKAADGKPFDQTYTEEIVDFQTLPDTPENRRLLALG